MDVDIKASRQKHFQNVRAKADRVSAADVSVQWSGNVISLLPAKVMRHCPNSSGLFPTAVYHFH